jgi:hypothetical protein
MSLYIRVKLICLGNSQKEDCYIECGRKIEFDDFEEDSCC